ncbi:condensation domain-containing protein [Micromonospora sp. NPDC048999]|uniref:condensation domain-containing protein n=1 Tax=Micromonospora sp. NPDC048999 TaxID=3155391 RepID=UPI00340E9BE1
MVKLDPTRDGPDAPGGAVSPDRLPLSFNQEFLCMFDSDPESGPFGPSYHIMLDRRLAGPIDQAALRGALLDLVRRHEALRTRIVRGVESPYQQVFPASPPRLEVRECPGVPHEERPRRAAAFLNELECSDVDADELPHVRPVIMYFDQEDAVLALLMHHTAVDGWSLPVIARDLVELYAARCAGTPGDLPPVPQYRDFVAWERARAGSRSMTTAERYWAEALRGAELTALRCDHPRSAKLPPVTAAHRFVIPANLGTEVTRLARQARCSPFMVLLAAYYRLVQRLTGATDIVVSTHTPGRGNGLFDSAVGSFFNFVPLRTRLDEGTAGLELLWRTRDTCLAAYAHDVPSTRIFDAAPDLMAAAMRDDLAPVTFQALPFVPDSHPTTAGGVTFNPVPRPQTGNVPVTAQIPDGALWTLSFRASGDIAVNVAYRTDRFDHQTIDRLAAEYQGTLETLTRELAGA